MPDGSVCFYCGTPFAELYGCDFCNKPVRPAEPGPMGEFRPEDTGPVKPLDSDEQPNE